MREPAAIAHQRDARGRRVAHLRLPTSLFHILRHFPVREKLANQIAQAVWRSARSQRRAASASLRAAAAGTASRKRSK
jgi:hypothetical protein